MDKPVEQALVVGLFTLSKLLRAAPNLAEAGPGGTSLVIEAWKAVLDGELPTLTAVEVQAALQAHAGASPFFPAPAELIAQVRQIRAQKALAAAEEARDERMKALPAPDDETALAARDEALAAIGRILDDLARRMTALGGWRGAMSSGEMAAEVARLRALDATDAELATRKARAREQLRVIDGGRA